MVLQRSAKALKSKSVFFRQFNDVDIYIEDTEEGARKLYAILFQRALGDQIRLETVFPLGGRQSVLNHCVADQDAGGRPRLYILDGDLDLLAGDSPSGHRRLFVLPRYCIENYLIDEQAILAVLDEEDTVMSKRELENRLAFDEWVAGNETGLFKLFVLYAIAHISCESELTVSFPINQLVSGADGVIDQTKLSGRMEEIRNAVLQRLSEEEISAFETRISSQCERAGQPKLSYVSGKSYLFPLIIVRMRQITRLRSPNRVIKQRLAMRCNVRELSAAANLIS